MDIFLASVKWLKGVNRPTIATELWTRDYWKYLTEATLGNMPNCLQLVCLLAGQSLLSFAQAY